MCVWGWIGGVTTEGTLTRLLNAYIRRLDDFRPACDVIDYERRKFLRRIRLGDLPAQRFNASVDDASLAKAIETAELAEFIAALPEGLDTVVSERGASLSGGQKQRVMLARALAIDPRILFLDDFTARVDAATEARILANVARNYPDLTLVSISQKIEPVQDYDQIILLMEGEVLAKGAHAELARSSLDYAQILRSQDTTQRYEAA